MSLRTIGYQDGKPVRVDEGASGLGQGGPIRGHLVQGDPGTYELQRQKEAAQRYRERKAKP